MSELPLPPSTPDFAAARCGLDRTVFLAGADGVLAFARMGVDFFASRDYVTRIVAYRAPRRPGMRPRPLTRPPDPGRLHRYAMRWPPPSRHRSADRCR